MADARVPRPASIRIEGGGAYVARELVFVAGSGVTFSTELVDGRIELTVEAAGGSAAWADITGTPTTLAGYGITDACSDAELAAHVAAGDPHPAYALEAALGSAAAMAGSPSRAANGLLQLGAIGMFGLDAVVAAWRWNVGRLIMRNGTQYQSGMAVVSPSGAAPAGGPSTKAYTARESTANSGFAQGTRTLDTAVGFACAIAFKLPGAVTNRRVWVGLSSVNMSNSDTAAGEFVGVRWSTPGADAGWTVVSRNATTQTVGTVGSAALADVPYLLVLVKAPGSSTVALTLYRTDTEAVVVSATVSATLPASGTAIDFLVYSHGQGVMSTVELSHATTAVQPT